ncbi:hypothetical protein PITC_099540 [Penicillium italicum]|uniref:Uncharacterized protein n=1 Tax=Penicillium italicum TaxID=40296 RepID=A0A0A2KET3_PENIT|nr:hypothetical protein PITC_099540 [Penicillium italicum]
MALQFLKPRIPILRSSLPRHLNISFLKQATFWVLKRGTFWIFLTN